MASPPAPPPTTRRPHKRSNVNAQHCPSCWLLSPNPTTTSSTCHRQKYAPALTQTPTISMPLMGSLSKRMGSLRWQMEKEASFFECSSPKTTHHRSHYCTVPRMSAMERQNKNPDVLNRIQMCTVVHSFIPYHSVHINCARTRRWGCGEGESHLTSPNKNPPLSHSSRACQPFAVFFCPLFNFFPSGKKKHTHSHTNCRLLFN